MESVSQVTAPELFNKILKGEIDPRALTAFDPPRRGFIASWVQRWQANQICKAVGQMAIAAASAPQAARQGADIDCPMDFSASGELAPGIRQRVGMDPGLLRNLAVSVEPISCIIDHGVTQVCAYSQEAVFSQDGEAQSAGWQIVMEERGALPTAEDEREMGVIQHFIKRCGLPQGDETVIPPDGERPVGWQPSFKHFLSLFVRDSLTLDWSAVRRWPSSTNPTRYPVASFAVVDSAKIARTSPSAVRLKNGSPVETPYDADRKNTREPIRFVKLADLNSWGQVVANYTEDEMAVMVRNPRTDEGASGYPASEIERGAMMAKGWLYGINDNISRFEKDAVPPGLLVLSSDMSPQALNSFQLQWAQNFMGPRKRWQFPILPFPPGSGGGAQWISTGTSNRDMEYHQFMYWMGIIWHVIFKMHPSSTGWDGMNPVRAPLSEASPEAKFEQGEDMFLSPLLTHISDFINTELIWQIPKWRRRYRLKFVGLGDSDRMQEAQTALAELNAGTTTTRLIWERKDQRITTAMEMYPQFKTALDLPMPWGQGVNLLIQMENLEMQREQQKAAVEQQKGNPVEPKAAEIPPASASAEAPADNETLRAAPQPPDEGGLAKGFLL